VGIARSNPAEVVDVFVLCLLCVVQVATSVTGYHCVSNFVCCRILNTEAAQPQVGKLTHTHTHTHTKGRKSNNIVADVKFLVRKN